MKIAIPILLALLTAACSGPQQKNVVSDTVVDDYGRTVVVGANPTRIVSASPAVTEIVYALQQSHRLVGRTDFCLYPPAADSIPSIGGISNLNIEAIVALDPDLVLTASMIPERNVDQLHHMGVPVVSIIEKPHFDDLYGNIRRIGEILHCTESADSLVALLSARLAACPPLSEADADQSIHTLYYVVGFGATGNFTAGGNTFIDDIIQMAGARNLAHDTQGWSYSLEALMENDPDYIVIRREDSAAFCRTHPYKNLTAVRNGHVIGIESGTIDLQVPRNIDAILYLRERMAR